MNYKPGSIVCIYVDRGRNIIRYSSGYIDADDICIGAMVLAYQAKADRYLILVPEDVKCGWASNPELSSINSANGWEIIENFRLYNDRLVWYVKDTAISPPINPSVNPIGTVKEKCSICQKSSINQDI